MSQPRRTVRRSPLEQTVDAVVRQAEGDGLPLKTAGVGAMTELLRRHGFADPHLQAAAPAVARLLAELLTVPSDSRSQERTPS